MLTLIRGYITDYGRGRFRSGSSAGGKDGTAVGGPSKQQNIQTGKLSQLDALARSIVGVNGMVRPSENRVTYCRQRNCCCVTFSEIMELFRLLGLDYTQMAAERVHHQRIDWCSTHDHVGRNLPKVVLTRQQISSSPKNYLPGEYIAPNTSFQPRTSSPFFYLLTPTTALKHARGDCLCSRDASILSVEQI